MGAINGGVVDMHDSQEFPCGGEMEKSHESGRWEVWKCNCEHNCGKTQKFLKDKHGLGDIQ